MNKKMYFEPKEEVIFLQMSSDLLVGSLDDGNDSDSNLENNPVIEGPGNTGDLG